jgi:circadian clock protein KaiB
MEQNRFILYVAGESELSARARANFERLVQTRLLGHCALTTVDILKEPGAARRNRIVATPLLVREWPEPVIKILGDLSQETMILNQLGLDAYLAAPEQPLDRLEEEGQR